MRITYVYYTYIESINKFASFISCWIVEWLSEWTLSRFIVRPELSAVSDGAHGIFFVGLSMQVSNRIPIHIYVSEIPLWNMHVLHICNTNRKKFHSAFGPKKNIYWFDRQETLTHIHTTTITTTTCTLNVRKTVSLACLIQFLVHWMACFSSYDWHHDFYPFNKSQRKLNSSTIKAKKKINFNCKPQHRHRCELFKWPRLNGKN